MRKSNKWLKYAQSVRPLAKWKTQTLCVVLIGGLCLNACRRTDSKTVPASTADSNFLDPSSFSGTNALAEVEMLVNLGPREAGSEGSKRAAHHISHRLRLLGLTPHMVEFEEDTISGRKTFRNVVCRIKRGGKSIAVLVAHYDTKTGILPYFQGANDSGSGVGVLLEIARCLMASKADNGCDIELAFVDGEECVKAYSRNDGLHGSTRHAQELVHRGEDKRVVAVIVADMVGDSNLTVTIPRNSSRQLIMLAFDAAREENIREHFGLYNGEILDDHVPYLTVGIPAIDIIDFEYGSAPGRNDYWHTSQDTLDRLSPESLAMVGRVIIRILNKLCAHDR